MNTIPAPHETAPAAAPAPQEIALIDHELRLSLPSKDEAHWGEGMASILRRLS
jgi:hypothetical protein